MKRKSERVSHVSDSDGGYVGVPFTERGIAARRARFGGKIVFSPFVEFGVTMGCPNGHVQWTFKFEAWEGIWVREILEHDRSLSRVNDSLVISVPSPNTHLSQKLASVLIHRKYFRGKIL